MRKIIDEVDVICRHNADGTIVPLRLRFMNEDGEYETYTIKGCREAEKKGTHDDIMEKFEKLEKLKSAGLITPEEYERKRSALVDEL